MEQKYGEFVGVDNLYFAIVEEDTELAYTAGVPTYLAPVASIAGSPEVANKTTYYDNVAANNYVTEGKTELQSIVSNVPARLMAQLLGKKYDEASGRVFDTGEANPPKVALGFRFNMGTNGYRYYWYLNGTFSGGAEEASTKTSDVDEKTYQLTYTAVTTAHKWQIGEEEKPLKRVFGDTADVIFDPAGWFTQVQTPNTTGTPDEFLLSSSIPADNDTNVAIDEELKLTFNNVIAEYAVTLIDLDSLAVVDISTSLNASKKILTILPDEDLTLDSDYAIVISKVTDVFGQSIIDTVISFKTVAA